MSDTEQLKPCPYCGNTETPHVISYFDCDYVDQSEGIDGFIVICDASGFARKKGCGAATGWHETVEEAVAAWNRRATEANLEVNRELLEENRRLRQFHKSVMGYRSGNTLLPGMNTIFMSDAWLMEQHHKVGIAEEKT